jgi:malate/lactate dehydrogenase
MMGEKKVMIVGLGNIGNYALEFLVRTRGVDSIFTADINKEVGLSKTNNAMLGAAQMGFYPHVAFIHFDVNQIEKAASVLNKIAPDVVLSCVTLQAYWVIQEIPKDLYIKSRLIGGYGPWLPLHLTPTYKLMQAIKKAGIKTHVVVASWPDAVCPVLGKVGLAPTIGLGNMDNFVPGIKKIVAEKLHIPMGNIFLYVIGHHMVSSVMRYGKVDREVPYYLKIFAENKDVTREFNLDQLLEEVAHLQPHWRSDSKVASSGVKNVLAILNNTGEITHSPGPQGLPGTYPVRLSSQGAEVVLPDGVSMEEAIRINEEGQKYDGIERIEDDGTVVHTEKAVKFMKEMFGYDCARIRFEENEEKAKELMSCYSEFIAKLKKQ